MIDNVDVAIGVSEMQSGIDMDDLVVNECVRLWNQQYPKGISALLIAEAIGETNDADLLFMFSMDDAEFGKHMRERIVSYCFAGIREQAERNVKRNQE